MKALSWASSQVSLCASVSPGAGHFPTSPQPLSLLPSSISFCDSSFKSKRGQLERILLKFHHHKRSTTGKNKTQCLMVIAHQKQNSHPKYPDESFDLIRKAMWWCTVLDLHQDCIEEGDVDALKVHGWAKKDFLSCFVSCLITSGTLYTPRAMDVGHSSLPILHLTLTQWQRTLPLPQSSFLLGFSSPLHSFGSGFWPCWQHGSSKRDVEIMPMAWKVPWL